MLATVMLRRDCAFAGRHYEINTTLTNWLIRYLSRDMKFPTIRYVRQAQPQISLRIRAVWSVSLLVAWIFYECLATDWTPFGVTKLKRRLHRLLWVYNCQNTTMLEITCRGSFVLCCGFDQCISISLQCSHSVNVAYRRILVLESLVRKIKSVLICFRRARDIVRLHCPGALNRKRLCLLLCQFRNSDKNRKILNDNFSDFSKDSIDQILNGIGPDLHIKMLETLKDLLYFIYNHFCVDETECID